MTTHGSHREAAPRVGVVVLAHNGAKLTVECLASVLAGTSMDRHVIVVDNGSGDGTAEQVEELFEEVEVLRSEENLGFAGGMNLGMAHAIAAGVDFVCILNNDTIVGAGAIERLVHCAQAHPEAGAVAPLITYADPADRIWYAGAACEPRKLHPGRVQHYRSRLADVSLAAGPTGRFTGAAVLFPRDVLSEVGTFDPSLFFLYEDVELSLRLRASGRPVWFEPAAVVQHRVAMTQGGEHSAASFYYGTRNQIVVARRFGGPRWSASLASLLIHLVRTRRSSDPRAALHATWRGFVDAARGRLGMRPA